MRVLGVLCHWRSEGGRCSAASFHSSAACSRTRSRISGDSDPHRIALTWTGPTRCPRRIERMRVLYVACCMLCGRMLYGRMLHFNGSDASVCSGLAVPTLSHNGRSGNGRSGNGRSGNGRSGNGRSGNGQAGIGYTSSTPLRSADYWPGACGERVSFHSIGGILAKPVATLRHDVVLTLRQRAPSGETTSALASAAHA